MSPLRGGNLQLSPENTPIERNTEGNKQATSDLKAMAISRLAKIRSNSGGNQQATGELPTMQLSPPDEATKVATPEEGGGQLPLRAIASKDSVPGTNTEIRMARDMLPHRLRDSST